MPIALRTSATGLAAAAGPVVGGALAGQFGWRSVFLLNVLPALAVGVQALAVRAPAHPRAAATRLDPSGAALLAVALFCMVDTLVGLLQDGTTLPARPQSAAGAPPTRSVPAMASTLSVLAAAAGLGALLAAGLPRREWSTTLEGAGSEGCRPGPAPPGSHPGSQAGQAGQAGQ